VVFPFSFGFSEVTFGGGFLAAGRERERSRFFGGWGWGWGGNEVCAGGA